MTREEQIETAWRMHQDSRSRLAISRGLTVELRHRLAEAQNWRCCYCGIRMDGPTNAPDSPTFEHIVPRSRGGADDETNLAVACLSCNNRRGND
jgi:5-methylcytosine-specific restriction endonuclease McrA